MLRCLNHSSRLYNYNGRTAFQNYFCNPNHLFLCGSDYIYLFVNYVGFGHLRNDL